MASVFDGVPALQPMDIRLGLAALMEGLQQRFKNQGETSKRNMLAGIGSQIQAGDYPGAAGAAFGAGELQAGLDITKLGQNEKDSLKETLARHITLADTPEKWARVVPVISQTLGPEFEQGYGDFAMRDAALAELGTTEQINMALTRSDKAEERAREAPDVIEYYDDSGRKQKGVWDAEQGAIVPLGGPEAPKKGGGFRIVNNPDGTTTIEQGGEEGLTAPTTNKVQDKALNAAEQGSRLAGMMKDFKPEYQELGTKALNAKRSWQAWIGGADSLAPGDRQELSEFSAYRAKTFTNFSSFLNELSGAAISPAEAVRLTQSMPNAGTGIFDGDDPVTFQSKMETVASEVQRALKRYEYYQANGIPGNLETIPLNDVKQVNGAWYVKDGDKWFAVGTNAP